MCFEEGGSSFMSQQPENDFVVPSTRVSMGAVSPPFWNVPPVLTPLIGRELDVKRICALLTASNVRLLTLLGTGGVGKTRLSIQVAMNVREYFVDGVCFVSLAAINDPELVLSSIAREIGIQDAGPQLVFAQVKDFLRAKHCLLLLDNFEQVVSAAPYIQELLVTCPYLSILTTSRAVLHVQGEQEFQVVPLTIPDVALQLDEELLLQVASVALFLQRARSVMPTFRLTANNAQVIAEICTRLDGLPLAIELAAARIKLLPPQMLLTRLLRSLEILTGGMSPLLPRQQTLRGALKWSYDLLDQPEQRLFRRLAVFVGSWMLEAIEAVCFYDTQQKDALNGVASLLDKSLLFQSDVEGDEPRFQILITVREYALECLHASGEAEDVQMAHARYYLTLAENVEQQFGGEQALYLDRLEKEHSNLRAALHFLYEQREDELALRLSSALYWFWSIHGHLNEGYLWLQKTLEHGPLVGEIVRAKALKNAGALAYALGRPEEAEQLCWQSLALYRQLGDPQGSGLTLYWLAVVACWSKQDYALAKSLAEESFNLHFSIHDKSGMADALMISGYVALNQGAYAEAQRFLEQGLAYFNEASDSWGVAYALQDLGRLLLEQELYDAALKRLEESQRISTQLGYIKGIAYVLSLKGQIFLKQGDSAAARASIEEALAKHRERGQHSGTAEALMLLARVSQATGTYAEAQRLYMESLALLEPLHELRLQVLCMEGLGMVALSQGNATRAVLLWGATDRLRKLQGIPMSPLDRTDYLRARTSAREQLGEETFVLLWTEGHTMSLGQALSLQSQSSSIAASSARPVPALPTPPIQEKSRASERHSQHLTAREMQVLQLLAQGLTDIQIAGRLVISPRTVSKHVSTIYGKIGVSSRSAATLYAMQNNLV
jgi:predicted ATPase/DNA-binding CsgD family transcriptional regulator/predicted negative regulator of RcsB-dependent stress response